MLSPSELAAYSKMQPNRDSKPMLVLEIGRITIYPDGIRYHRSETMSGEYMKPEAYARIQQMIQKR